MVASLVANEIARVRFPFSAPNTIKEYNAYRLGSIILWTVLC